MSLLLQASGLGYRYTAQHEPLFTELNLTLYAGDRVALLGANGTGKTTLLGLLSGTLTPQNGTDRWCVTPNRFICAKRTR